MSPDKQLQKNDKKTILDYFKETHAMILTEKQYAEIVDKIALANYIRKSV